ncbi:NAD-dependent epimerase/dehydratase family protein [Amnibacterium setariae]|uniref:NAD-dependent epimerase/dehydratase family protein n=1 Tax=Amnibacterium setariae TaxID=2306585 RepID=A0A3A1U1F2_9MICO|nr:NAD-dependent epimerase/dehydratase family protein [Amnibacterium setariae]RIX30170.1 NAD-dependent epimerase/dehydratase family protein [Amnibacterium setariae]
MRVFITGASGWIGSATTASLLARGHQVVGAARSDASADRLERLGAEVRRTDLDDLDGLRAGALDADAVVHLANKHDFSDPVATNRAERDAVQTFVDALTGTDKPLLLASGLAGYRLGRPIAETDRIDARGPEAMRGGTENLVLDAAADGGLHGVSLRFAPTVHGAGDHGFIAFLVQAARQAGAALYVGDGANAWSAVHVSDAGDAVARAVERAHGGTAVHAVAEEGIPTREIAEAIGRGLGLPTRSVSPEEASERLGFIGHVLGMDLRASSDATRGTLGWIPTGPTLLEDLATDAYFRA